MGNTPGIPSRASARDSGTQFEDSLGQSRNSGGDSHAPDSLPASNLLPLPSLEELRHAARSLELELPLSTPASLLQRSPANLSELSGGARAESYFSLPLEMRERNAETLQTALQQFRRAGSRSEHCNYLQSLASDLVEQLGELPAFETRLEQIRLLAQVYGELSSFENRSSDRQALTVLLNRWLDELSTHPIDDETRISDLRQIATLSRQRNLILPGLEDAFQGLVHEWRELGNEDPRQNIQARQQAYRLLQGTWQALGETGQNLFQDLLDDLDRDARRLEAQAREAAPEARVQLLGEVAALYRQMSNHPETGEHYRGRWRQCLGEILEVAGAEDFPAALRLQVRLGVLRERESGGENTAAQSLRETMLTGAEAALSQGRHPQSSIAERYQALLEALQSFRELGESRGLQRSEASLRRFLAEMEVSAARSENPELGRQITALSLEAFLELGDLDAAGLRLEELRQTLTPSLERNEALAENAEGLGPRAQSLLQLANYAQRIAIARSELSGEAPDFSSFREILGDLSSLGERSGQASMALYGRFMAALLDQDPATEILYQELQAWRPDSFAAWNETPALFAPQEVRDYQADPFQRMAAEIWRVQGPMTLLPRAASTLQFLSLLIEGNHNARRAAAEAAGQATAPLEAERAQMRRYLSHVQNLVMSGRAASTREAILMLPEALGEEQASRNFYRSIEGAFASSDLSGREVGAGNLVSRLIDSEAIADPETRAQAWLSLSREMIVADSLNHRADPMIGAMLESAEQFGGRGRAPRPLLEILGDLAGGSRDLDDFAELHNRLAGNENLRQQIQGTRDAGLYVQTANQIVDSVFSVEGGAIMLASIFTAGIAAELAGAAMLTRLGSGAFTVVNGVSRMTWAARLSVGATRIGAAWLARSATELGGIAAYRAASGRRAMSLEEARVRLITSLFCSLGDEFATHLVRASLGRALGNHHAVTEVSEFLASGLGEMWGEDIGARVAGQAADNRPFLLRYFEETLHGSFFVAGTRVGAPLAASLHGAWQSSPPRLRPESAAETASAEVDLEINVRDGVAQRRGSLVAGLLSRQANPRIEHFRILRFYRSGDRNLVELTRLEGGESTSFALSLEENEGLRVGQEISFIPAIEGGSGRHRFFVFEEWLESASILAANSPELEDFTRELGHAWEQSEITFPETIRSLRDYIRQETPAEIRPGLLSSLAAVLARQDMIEASHQILEEEPLSLREIFPDLPEVWDSEEDLARAQLVQALANQGRFEGEINPVYHLTKIRHAGARRLAWRSLLSGLVVRGQWQRAQDLLTSFERNPRVGTPAEERPLLRQLLLEIIHHHGPRGRSDGSGGVVAALLAAGSGLATLLGPEVAHAAFEISDHASSGGWWSGLGLALGGLAMVAARRRRRGPPEHPYVPFLARWIGSAWHFSAHDAAFVEASAALARRFESGEFGVDELSLELRALIHRTVPEGGSALLYELAMSLAESGLIEPAKRLLDEEDLPGLARQAIPNVPNYWYIRDGEVRLALMQAMVRQGVFEGPFSPLDQLNQIRDQSQRLQGWRILIEGLVFAGRENEARELAESLNRNAADDDVAYEAVGVQIALHSATAARRRNGGNNGGGIMASALLAAGAGAATWLSAASAQAQQSLGPSPEAELGGLLTLGGLFAAGLYYLYRHSESRRLGELRERIDTVSENDDAESRRELADWLFEEARANREHFHDGSHHRALLQKIHVGNLAALDVYLRLLERNDPSARQLLSARDRMAAERLLLRQNLGNQGLERLIYATLDARLSAPLMDELVARIHRPAVFARVRDGIKNGAYREGQILLRALERADPDQAESLEDLVHLLQGLERKNFFHVRKFLQNLRSRPELAHWLSPDLAPETPNRGGSGGLATLLLAAGAGAATWLGAETAHAAVRIGEAAGDGTLFSASTAALLGIGVLATAISRGGSSNPPSGGGTPETLSRALFLENRRLTWVGERLRERFISHFALSSPEERAQQLADLQSHLARLAEAGLPLSIHPPFLELLLRQEDPRYALDFFNALSRLGPASLHQLGTPLASLARGLDRRGLSRDSPASTRELRGGDPRHFQTPAWLGRFREVLNEHFSSEVEEVPAELALRDIFPIHYLDNHSRGDGAAALNGARQNILHRLALQNWRPGEAPSTQELSVALLDDQSHLPLLSRGDARNRRLLLNGHHRIGALISLVADGLLPEEVLARIPFHVAAEVEPEALIHRAFAGASLPNPRFSLNWLELMGFDDRSREWLGRYSLNQDLVGWIREVRIEDRESRARRSPRER